jgi:hypothetical protein
LLQLFFPQFYSVGLSDRLLDFKDFLGLLLLVLNVNTGLNRLLNTANCTLTDREQLVSDEVCQCLENFWLLILVLAFNTQYTFEIFFE